MPSRGKIRSDQVAFAWRLPTIEGEGTRGGGEAGFAMNTINLTYHQFDYVEITENDSGALSGSHPAMLLAEVGLSSRSPRQSAQTCGIRGRMVYFVILMDRLC
jgi:hypothetical protein